MHSNFYTFVYAAAISILTAVVLAFTAEGLKPAQEANIALDKKSNILKSVRQYYTKRADIEKVYGEGVHEIVVNAAGEELTGVDANAIVLKEEMSKPVAERQLPVYIYTDQNSKKYYILPLQGVGLWGPIWGFLSLESDVNTVYGAFFGHKSETPGLGAEIADLPFQKQFEGKKILAADNSFVSVHVIKKTNKFDLGTEHRVDGISGGTITSDGTDKMIKNSLEPYLTYLEKQKIQQ